MKDKTILDYETVALNNEKTAIVIIDQTKLPYDLEMLTLRTQKEVWTAIYLLQVRGAPAIGVTAGFGLYLAARDIDTDDKEEFFNQLLKAKEYLATSRPTAVNLFWALDRVYKAAIDNETHEIKDIVKIIYDEAIKIRDEDIWVCKQIGEYGLSLVKPGDGLLTHCNAGKLATVKYGTATAPMYLGHERDYNFHIFADETRPLLQGARLTAYELHEAGMDVTLICDNMSSMVMKNGWVNAIFVGCDRVAANGDAANKIGTSAVAILAKRYDIPFYVCAPTSTIDLKTKTGNEIEIEERPDEEVTEMWYKERMAPEGIKVFNPAFDVTDNDLITGIVTEYGIAKAPYTKSLKEIMNKKQK